MPMPSRSPTETEPGTGTEQQAPSAAAPGFALEPSTAGVLLRLTGAWTLENSAPSPAEGTRALGQLPTPRGLSFDTDGLEDWDSALLVFLLRVERWAGEVGVEVSRAGLPEGVRRLLALATAVPPKATGGDAGKQPAGLVTRVGNAGLAWWSDALRTVAFVGAATLAFGALLRGKARFRRSDLMLVIQEVGPEALPVVSLIGFLVGLILAFVGAVQLQQFGAQIYVANLVGLGMAREMGAMMAGIIMAGRTGAAFAAQLGAMQVNEEIDAFRTLGIDPMEFLVLPRMLALVLIMPLITLYADLMGILGGAAVGIFMLDLEPIQYLEQTRASLSLTDFATGLFKGSLFGVLIAIAGCMRGMQSGRSSAAVGIAATSAVVTGIVYIIVTDGLMAVVLNVLGI
jgi:phospholipid/cholesterol/gamma-HCH transport system permease protein